MSNESPVEFVSDYEYITKQLIGNVLNLQGNFGGMNWTREELYIIAKELENTGKLFAEKQGLVKTGNLVSSTHATVENQTKINFFNNARNPYGHFYAGHIEYGYHSRKGNFIPARPFMRPALYAVAEASRGMLQGALGRYLSQIVNGVPGASSSLNTLTFGRAQSSMGYTRVFYRQQTLGRGASSKAGHYTSKGLSDSSRNKQGGFGKIGGQSARTEMSVIRGKDESRLMTTHSTLDRLYQSDSTRHLGQYSTSPGRTGRPAEGRARVSSGRPVGRPATGRKEYYKPTGRPVGRPRTGRKQYYTPRGRPVGRPSKPKVQGPKRAVGRPRIYNSPKDWPSRQPTGNPRGRPRKPASQKTLTRTEKIKNRFSKVEWSGASNKNDYKTQWAKKHGGGKNSEWGKNSLVNPEKNLQSLYEEVKSGKSGKTGSQVDKVKGQSIGNTGQGSLRDSIWGRGSGESTNPYKNMADGVYKDKNGKEYYVYQGKRIEKKG